MTLQLFFLIIDITAILASTLIALRSLTSAPRLRAAQLLALIGFDTVCHILLSRYEYRYWIAAPFRFDVGGWYVFLNFARNLTPGVFMMLCFTMFADRRRFPRWLLALFGVQMALEATAHWIAPGWRFQHLLTQVAPSVLETLFVAVALYWTLADWRNDLVETRRPIRAFTLFVIGVSMIFSSLFMRVLIAPDIVANFWTHEGLNALNAAIALYIFFQLDSGNFVRRLDPAHAAPRPPAPPERDPETAAALAKLERLMEVERVYRRPSLTLKGLADLVGVPEYRLRKLIHENLDYRNFNAYLHGYRIREACLQLRDPKMRRIPILTIALSVGYQSVNTFNRGFKEILDLTPSAYRAQDAGGEADIAEKITPEST